ncbi:MAG TPA: DUF5615 family PIN-like protein [Micromonosporaceae bacterium]|jgi:Domain of unknown function (DUF5615)|nr:DUF5615 family PIN-like protein [Micromonosporaceae bacterium]
MTNFEDESLTLLLDEMHHPLVAEQLRQRGYDVIAAADTAELRALSDAELFRWAAERKRWIVTENIKDFRRLVANADEAGGLCAHVVYTTSHAFPRSRRNLGLLITALEKWLTAERGFRTGYEHWLTP